MIKQFMNKFQRKHIEMLSNDDVIDSLVQVLLLSTKNGVITVAYKASEPIPEIAINIGDKELLKKLIDHDDGLMHVHVNNVPIPDKISAQVLSKIDKWIKFTPNELKAIILDRCDKTLTT